ncbi:MAG: pyridoxal phosphate-dependent aminotransferase, partial [Proteobacteria bacterium]
RRTPSGETLENAEQALSYLLDEAKIGILPFSFFGAQEMGNWYRISVGTCRIESIPELIENLEQALLRLS